MEDNSENKNENTEFKKPVLIGRIGKLPKKAKLEADKPKEPKTEEINIQTSEPIAKSSLPPAVLMKELSTPIPYKEPKWSGICPDGSEYGLEVLKSGMIVEKVDLTTKPFYVFGRLANCDVVMAHPTISRHHCVLQYKAFADEGEPPCGWYLYDLGSTHGTFLNRDRIKEKHYSRVRVGHQIKFGNSTRTYILLGPDFDCEGESELTVTEIKQKALDMKLTRAKMIQEAKEAMEKERLEEEKKREEQGIDWGMGEDADEEPDLAENPYATTANEELYLTDPKKTLRGYFEREGHELSYNCEERGVGQFICRVELPIDDARGRPVVAEVIHRGKKKEAVVACALEACRVLDRAGLLRQSKHESRRRKERDWSADDYYDSDDDSFLDRTGHVERKRKMRMIKLGAAQDNNDKPLTYDDLLKQIEEIEEKIIKEEKSLARLRSGGESQTGSNNDDDALDAYMNELASKPQAMAVKADISKTKMNIQKLKAELAKTQRLADIARPAHAPPIIKKDDKKMTVKVGSNSVVYGKRLKLKDGEKRPKVKQEMKKEETEFVEEMDSDEESETKNKTETKLKTKENNNGIKETESIDNRPEIEKSVIKNANSEIIKVKNDENPVKRMFGPMRPPDDYVVPEGYFDQETDRDLPEIEEKE
ncbi:PREDICTED: kanadaptin [Papilio xuthus]|uniref:Kanadaptin n=1 Tax=Papilio xuthus TaxID=66420 RepID=A0AAJ6ZMK1_PAPXU|nr:PREDICTED: kanadaptin [Papilio xuthus]